MLPLVSFGVRCDPHHPVQPFIAVFFFYNGSEEEGGANFKKFFELQILMLQHNAGLTASHPYASGPINWPFLISGISFWTQSEGQKQIYFIGNLVGWWTCVIGISLYTGIMLADIIARRRDIEPLTERKLLHIFD